MSKKLEKYNEKRHLSKTIEPGDSDQKTDELHKNFGNPLFVIQQHDATNMHYDFRLEIDGVLKSWAIPKGPSTDPQEKRLAIETEDHPIAYANFEGVIPKDNYGAGTVLVWDIGTYENTQEENLKKQYQNGKITVFLHGKKLQGEYSLVHTVFRGDKKNWLLIKKNDEYSDARRNPVSTEQRSVISEKTLSEIASESK